MLEAFEFPRVRGRASRELIFPAEGLIFGFSEMVKLQYFHGKRLFRAGHAEAVQGGEVNGDLLQFGFGVVHACDDRHPDEEVRCASDRLSQVFEHGVEVASGAFSETFRRPGLQIRDCEGGRACGGREARGGGVAFESRVNPVSPEPGETVEKFVRLQGGLSAAKRYSAEIAPSERQAQDFLFELAGRALKPGPFQCGVANPGAFVGGYFLWYYILIPSEINPQMAAHLRSLASSWRAARVARSWMPTWAEKDFRTGFSGFCLALFRPGMRMVFAAPAKLHQVIVCRAAVRIL